MSTSTGIYSVASESNGWSCNGAHTLALRACYHHKTFVTITSGATGGCINIPEANNSTQTYSTVPCATTENDTGN